MRMSVSKVSTAFVVLLSIFARSTAVPRFCEDSSECREKDGERCGKNFEGIGFVSFDEAKTDEFAFYQLQGEKEYYGACVIPTREQKNTTHTGLDVAITVEGSDFGDDKVRDRFEEIFTKEAGASSGSYTYTATGDSTKVNVTLFYADELVAHQHAKKIEEELFFYKLLFVFTQDKDQDFSKFKLSGIQVISSPTPTAAQTTNKSTTPTTTTNFVDNTELNVVITVEGVDFGDQNVRDEFEEFFMKEADASSGSYTYTTMSASTKVNITLFYVDASVAQQEAEEMKGQLFSYKFPHDLSNNKNQDFSKFKLSEIQVISITIPTTTAPTTNKPTKQPVETPKKEQDSPERDAEIEYYTTAFIACGIMLGVIILIAIFGVMCGKTAIVKGDAPEQFSQRTQEDSTDSSDDDRGSEDGYVSDDGNNYQVTTDFNGSAPSSGAGVNAGVNGGIGVNAGVSGSFGVTANTGVGVNARYSGGGGGAMNARYSGGSGGVNTGISGGGIGVNAGTSGGGIGVNAGVSGGGIGVNAGVSGGGIGVNARYSGGSGIGVNAGISGRGIGANAGVGVNAGYSGGGLGVNAGYSGGGIGVNAGVSGGVGVTANTGVGANAGVSGGVGVTANTGIGVNAGVSGGGIGVHTGVSGGIGAGASAGDSVNAGVSGGIGVNANVGFNTDTSERSAYSSSEDSDEDMGLIPELTESPLVSATKTTGWSVQPAVTVGASAGVGVGGSAGVGGGVGISVSAGYNFDNGNGEIL